MKNNYVTLVPSAFVLVIIYETSQRYRLSSENEISLLNSLRRYNVRFTPRHHTDIFMLSVEWVLVPFREALLP